MLRRIFGPKRGVEKTTWWGALCSVLLARYNSDDQIKKTEMDREYSTYVGEKNCAQGFDGET
jgi:hypothetical protein